MWVGCRWSRDWSSRGGTESKRTAILNGLTIQPKCLFILCGPALTDKWKQAQCTEKFKAESKTLILPMINPKPSLYDLSKRASFETVSLESGLRSWVGPSQWGWSWASACSNPQPQHFFKADIFISCSDFFWSGFPHQGLNPRPLEWKHGVLTTEPPGKSPVVPTSQGPAFF